MWKTADLRHFCSEGFAQNFAHASWRRYKLTPRVRRSYRIWTTFSAVNLYYAPNLRPIRWTGLYERAASQRRSADRSARRSAEGDMVPAQARPEVGAAQPQYRRLE